MARTEFDAVGFYQALDSTRINRELSWRKVAKEAGISPSTLTRLAQGKRPDVDSLTKLTTWAGLKVEDFIRTDAAAPERGETLAMISTYLRSDPQLSPESATALEEMIKMAYKRLRKAG